MHQRKELFFERRLFQTRIVAHRSHRRIDFLLEEVQRDIVFTFEVIKNRAFGDLGFARDDLGGGSVEASGLKEIERGFHDAFADSFFICSARGDAASRLLPRSRAATFFRVAAADRL
jgi:hypothetical protein